MIESGIAADRNEALLRWYAEHRRALPWRETRQPYPILVAEVMSQQTQIDRVIPHWALFMTAFPTVEDLAVAPLSDVVRAWSGLGYNTRAKRLHAAARQIAETGWPRTSSGLEKLPGVGSYTARAVAAFAFGEQTPAVDTNLRRVLSRWHGEPLDGAPLNAAADGAIANTDATLWNQAVMDLGALVCRPRGPKCSTCPVSDWCAGPDVYVAPRAQPRFEGSGRQVRGAVVRTLIHGEASLGDIATQTGFDRGSVALAIGDLIDEGLLEPGDEDTYRLAD